MCRDVFALAACALSLATPSIAHAQFSLGPEIAVDAPVISPAPYLQYATSAASNGSNFLVALDSNDYSAPYHSYFAVVNGDGTVATSPSTIAGDFAHDQRFSAVAYNGSVYGALYATYDGTRNNIAFLRIGSDGRAIDDPPAHAASPDAFWYVQLAATSTTWLVAWEQNSSVRPEVGFARLRADGVLLDPIPAVIAGPFRTLARPALAGHADGAIVVFQQDAMDIVDTNATRVAFRRFDRDGNLVGTLPTLVSPLAGAYALPAVAYSSGAYLIVWRTETGIEGVRVDTSGTVLDAAPISIVTTATDAAYTDAPSVVAQENGWLVTWIARPRSDGNGTLHGARVSASGVVLDTVPRPLGGSRTAGPTILAWNGTTTLAVRNESAEGGSHAQAFRLSPSVDVLDPPGTIGRAGNGEHFVALSRGTTDLLAGWFDERLGPSGAIAFIRLGTDGTPSSAPAQIVPATSDSIIRNLAITASSGAGYLATWTEADWASQQYHLRALRLDATGAPLDSTPRVLRDCPATAYGCLHPSMTFDGDSYLVAIVTHDEWLGEVHMWRVGLDGSGAEVAVPGITRRVGEVIALGSNGDGSVLVLEHDFQLSFVRMARDGTVLDDVPRPLTPYRGSTAGIVRVLSRDSAYDVFMSAGSSGGGPLYFTRLAADGTVVSSYRPVMLGVGSYDFDISDTGSNYLFTWDHSLAYMSDSIAVARVAYDGTAIDSTGIDLLPGSAQPPHSRSATLSSGDAIIAYQVLDTTPAVMASRIRVRVLSASRDAMDAGVDAGADESSMDGNGSDAGIADARFDADRADGGEVGEVRDAGTAGRDAVAESGGDAAPLWDAGCRCDLRTTSAPRGSAIGWMALTLAVVGRRSRPNRRRRRA